MIITYAFKAVTIFEMLSKINIYKNRHPESESSKLEAFYDNNLQFSKYFPEAEQLLVSKLETRGGKKLMSEKGHFSITFISGKPTLTEIAKNNVIWE